jgi:hypothetical protein
MVVMARRRSRISAATTVEREPEGEPWAGGRVSWRAVPRQLLEAARGTARGASSSYARCGCPCCCWQVTPPVAHAKSSSSPAHSATLTCGARTLAAAPVGAEHCAAKCAALMGEFVRWLPAEQVAVVEESHATLRSSLHFFCKVRSLAGTRIIALVSRLIR